MPLIYWGKITKFKLFDDMIFSENLFPVIPEILYELWLHCIVCIFHDSKHCCNLLFIWRKINRLPIIKHLNSMWLVRWRKNNSTVLQSCPFLSLTRSWRHFQPLCFFCTCYYFLDLLNFHLHFLDPVFLDNFFCHWRLLWQSSLLQALSNRNIILIISAFIRLCLHLWLQLYHWLCFHFCLGYYA
eukprot:Gb_13081 [translate_table: standard]